MTKTLNLPFDNELSKVEERALENILSVSENSTVKRRHSTNSHNEYWRVRLFWFIFVSISSMIFQNFQNRTWFPVCVTQLYPFYYFFKRGESLQSRPNFQRLCGKSILNRNEKLFDQSIEWIKIYYVLNVQEDPWYSKIGYCQPLPILAETLDASSNRICWDIFKRKEMVRF